MALTAEDRRIRGLRPPKPLVDVTRPLGTLLETERRAGGLESALTVFLAGAECAFTCVFCDLWRYTIDGATPAGALPAQLAAALDTIPAGPIGRIKLYNASNFFDPRAVPPEDLDAIGRLVAPFAGVTVESHARTVGPRALEFSRRLAGRLEVAVGLETVHPEALARLNKRMTLDDFDRAADFLRAHDLELRAFVLVGGPFIPPEEALRWTVRSAAHAIAAGAASVSLIPVRGGNGAMEELAAQGHFLAPTLADLECALEASLDLGGIVTADLWDAERMPGCTECSDRRLERIRSMNAGGTSGPPVECAGCGA